jgi:hypothetical protein
MPTLRRFRSRPLGLLVSLTLAVSGCGGSGGGKSSATTTTAAGLATTPTTASAASLLQAIVLQPGDLPAGWSSRPGGPSPTQGADSAAFAQCLSGRDTNPDVLASAYSPVFSMGTQTITSAANSYRMADDVTADTAALNNPKASACLATSLRSRIATSLPHGTTLKNLTVKITPGPGAGPANVAATATATAALISSGKPLTLLDTVVFITGPRIEAQVAFLAVGTQVPTESRSALIAKVAARAVAAG